MAQVLKYEVRHPLSMRVKAYRNLHKDKISLMNSKGQVIKHVDRVLLIDVKFHVREAGMLKAYNAFRGGLKSEKFPHAFVIGNVVAIDDEFEVLAGWGARYNPIDGLPYFSDAIVKGAKIERSEFAFVEALPDKKSRLLYNVEARLKLQTPSARLHAAIMWPHSAPKELSFR